MKYLKNTFTAAALSIFGIALLATIFSNLSNLKDVYADTTAFFSPPYWATDFYATSTMNYIRVAGTGTTTITINSDAANPRYGLDSVTLLLAINASSTLPALNYAVYDSPDGNDYYARTGPTQSFATTTNLTGNGADYKVAFATSTNNLSASNQVTQVNISSTFPVNTKYTRFVFYVPIGGTQVSLYARVIGRAQKF